VRNCVPRQLWTQIEVDDRPRCTRPTIIQLDCQTQVEEERWYLPNKCATRDLVSPKSSPATVSTSQRISLHPLTFSPIRLQIKSVQSKILENICAKSSFEASGFVMMIRGLRLRVSFSWMGDKRLECSLRWKTLHSEFGDKSTAEAGI
jgi:hypothetical protein